MANLVTYLSEKFRPYRFYITLVVLIIIFLSVSWNLYSQFSKKVLNAESSSKYSDVANNGSRQNEIEVYIFRADWCPHCKKSLPEWQAFSSSYGNTNVNGYLIKCIDQDCTNDKDPKVTSIMDAYKVKSFPTVIAIKDSKRYDFDSKVTKTNLDQFIQFVTA